MSEWEWTDNPCDPCIYCVQWRYVLVDGTRVLDGDLGGHPAPDAETEPYRPDGSVVPYVFRGTCARCSRALADMDEFNRTNP
jgi:hypothetical protein